MTSSRTHDQLREMLAAEALDQSSGTEGEAVHAHVAECESCAAELAAFRRAAAHLAFLAPREAMSPSREQRVRERLLARAKGVPVGRPGSE